jgi:polyferredoxin
MLLLWTVPCASWLDWELFSAFAWRAAPPLALALAAVFLILSIVVPRPYCRFVCPTGTLFKLAESNQAEPDRKEPRP